MSELILTDLAIETLTQMATEKAQLVEQHGRKTVKAAIDSGRCLIEIKSRLGHGQWLPWLEQNWRYSQVHAHRFMTLAANYTSGFNLDDADSVNDGLRMIAEAKEAAGTKRTRKPAVPAPEVEVIDNRPTPKPVEDVPTATKSFFDSDDMSPEEPPVLPKTNTLHTPATQQRIDRGPEPAPPQIVEPVVGMTTLATIIAQHTIAEILEELVSGYEGDQAKRVAKQLRQFADKLDPLEETKAPTLAQMRSIIDERAKLPPADDRHLKPPVAAAASEWAAHKISMPKAKRYQSRTSWEACLSRMATLSLDRGADVVCDMIQRAIASGYQGWEFEASAPRGGRPASRNTNIRTGRNFDAEMGPPINLADVEEF
jgi:hypothetical protein